LRSRRHSLKSALRGKKRAILTESRRADQQRRQRAAAPADGAAENSGQRREVRIRGQEKPQPDEALNADKPVALARQKTAQTRKKTFTDKASKGVERKMSIKVMHKRTSYERIWKRPTPNIVQRRFFILRKTPFPNQLHLNLTALGQTPFVAYYYVKC
jgi:hypothetical protein